MKNANSLQNKGYNLLGSTIGVQKMDENSEKIIEELMLECNKWKKEYSIMYNENNVLKKYISKLEKNLGLEEQMDNLRTLLKEKDQVLVNLSYQIKEYQSKIDNIIIGKTEESKDKQIQMLLNEVKGIRKRILNIITFNDRITNFEEFMEAIKTIKKLEITNKDKDIDKAFDQLTYLIEIYQQNDDNAYSKFVEEIYGEGKNINNLINFEEFGKEPNINNDNNNDNNNDDSRGGNNVINNGGLDNNNNNINNIYDKIDLDSINYNQNNNLDNSDFNNNNINNNNYNENGSQNFDIVHNENNDMNEKSNQEKNINYNRQNNNIEDIFDTNMNNNKEKDMNNNDMNFNTNEENDDNNKNKNENQIEGENNENNNNNLNQDNNFNENAGEENGNNDFNEDNNFDNAFDDINFDEFEKDNIENEPNNLNNNKNNDEDNGDDEVL